METVSEKFRAARARASRALDDVDRSRATRALAVAVAIATLATLNPTPESFHAVCSRGAHAGTSLAEKALPIRATRSWARIGRYRDAAAVRDAYRRVTQIFLVRHVDTRLTRARVVRFASNLSLSSALVDRRSIDRSMISLRARDARSLDERMRGYT